MDGYSQETSFRTQAISIKSDKRNTVQFSDDSWILKSNEKIGQGEKFDIKSKGLAGMGSLVDVNDSYVIPMSISLKAVNIADTSCKYNVHHYYQNVDGEYELQQNHSIEATINDDVTATPNNDDVAHYTYNSAKSETSGKASNTLVLKLYYDRIQYNVTFSAGNIGDVHGTVNGKNSVTEKVVWEGSFPKIPNVTASENYSFVGWKDGAGNMVNEDEFPVKVEQNITYTAVWKAKTAYTTQYLFEDANSGEYKENVNLGETVTGYGLLGESVTAAVLTSTLPAYYTEDTQKETAESSLSGTLSEGTELVLKRYYTLIPVTVEFKSGEHGKLNGQTSVTMTVKYGAHFPDLPTPTADSGWKFSQKWLDGSTEIKSTDFPEYVEENLSYVAVWEEDLAEYTTEFYFEDLNGNYNTGIAAPVKATGKAGSLVEAAVLGETIPAGYQPTEHKDQILSGTLTDGMVLKRYYKLNEYTITFNAGDNGTLIGDPDIDVKHGGKFPLVPETKPRDGYEFDGWYDENNKKIISFPEKVEEPHTYTVHWTKKLVDPTPTDPEPTDPKPTDPTPTPTDPAPTEQEPPKTGDSTPIYKTIFMVLASGIFAFCLVWTDRKRKRKHNY